MLRSMQLRKFSIIGLSLFLVVQLTPQTSIYDRPDINGDTRCIYIPTEDGWLYIAPVDDTMSFSYLSCNQAIRNNKLISPYYMKKVNI